MSIDVVVIKKLSDKLKEKNQSEEIIGEIIQFLKDKDSKKINLEEKNLILEKILNKLQL